MDALPVVAATADTYSNTLIAASTECVDTCAQLQRVAPALALSSVFARDVHTLCYVVSNVEIALHHFVDRELLQEAWVRRREQGARLQDALERVTSSNLLKSTVKASLLAGGIASLLHLFAMTLRRLNCQLESLLDVDRRGDAYAELAAAAAAAAVVRRSRSRRLRAAAAIACTACIARVVQLRLTRRRAAAALNATQERLQLTLHLWGMATSVLQRAHKANSSSYLELDRLTRLSSSSSRPPSPLGASERGNGHSPPLGPTSSLSGGHEVLSAAGNGSGLWSGSLPPSRSYPQLIAQPGLHDVDMERKQSARALFDTCCPWTASRVPHAFWWDTHPVLSLTKVSINAYYAAMIVALRAVRAARHFVAGGEYAIALVLFPWYLAFPRLAAAEVYDIWCRPVMTDMQAIYAPLRWPACVSFVRRTFASDLHFAEHRIRGVRIVVISKEKLGTERDAERDAEGEVYERPTILFVPGGAFVADFEAADLFFLCEWVRLANATVVYVTYEFAPQAPYPTGLRQVVAVYDMLRSGSHAHRLGFRATPLVVAGLSAGGNLAVASVLSSLLTRPSTLIGAAHDGARAEARSHEGGPQPSQLPMADAMLLICPVLNLNRSPSPSRVAFCSDTMLPQPLLEAFACAYDGGAAQESWSDPLLSPAFAPDEALRRLPPTNIQVGGFDPLLDDSVDFNTRIRRLGVPGELHIHRTLPHTYLSFPHWLYSIPEVHQALMLSVEWLEDMLWHGSSTQLAGGIQ